MDHKDGLMVHIIKDNLKMIKHMEKGNLYILMETHIKVIGLLIGRKELVNTREQLAVIMKEDGKMINLKVLASRSGVMVIFIKESFKTDSNKV
jgi:hypothetical protein